MIIVRDAAPPLLIHTEKGRRGHGALRPALRRMGREYSGSGSRTSFVTVVTVIDHTFFILTFNFKFREYMGKVQK